VGYRCELKILQFKVKIKYAPILISTNYALSKHKSNNKVNFN